MYETKTEHQYMWGMTELQEKGKESTVRAGDCNSLLSEMVGGVDNR